jgi:hypothetical protein
MGIERMHSAKYWRMRAEEFRTKADNCEYRRTRDSLRQVADNFEELARRAQQMIEADQSNQRRSLEARPVAQGHTDDQRATKDDLRHR